MIERTKFKQSYCYSRQQIQGESQDLLLSYPRSMVTTTIHKIFETNSRYQVEQRTAGKV